MVYQTLTKKRTDSEHSRSLVKRADYRLNLVPPPNKYNPYYKYDYCRSWHDARATLKKSRRIMVYPYLRSPEPLAILIGLSKYDHDGIGAKHRIPTFNRVSREDGEEP